LLIYEIAKTISEHDPVILRAEAALRELRDTLDESVLLAKVNGLGATYLLTLDSTHPLRFLMKVGDNVRSLHATSAGKALLGSLDEAAFGDFLRTAKLPAMTARTIRSKTTLRDEIAAGNRRGWFVNREESIEGVTTLSARFVWTSSVYIVTIAGPTSRILPMLDKATHRLIAVCKRLDIQSGRVA
jgi:DNA-binding IclR family transcriptional regulator